MNFLYVLFILMLSFVYSDDSAFNPRVGWLSRRMKAYRVLTGIDASFQEANDICRVLFSYNFGHSYSHLTLVTILSEEEQKTIYSLILASKQSHDQFWIGAKKNEFGLKWVDGTDVKYKNFAENRAHNSGKCVAIDATRKGRMETPGKWIFDHCSARKAVICQRA